MNFPFFIARRYLFSKKRHNAINIISSIAVGGVALATMAMVCVLSGFNGFHDLIGGLFTNIDPQLEVVPTKGKVAAADDPHLDAIRKDPAVAAFSATLEDDALILFRGRPTVIRLKGIDERYADVTGIRQILYGKGDFELQRANLNYGIPGFGLANSLGGLQFGEVEICVPRKGEQINLLNPAENINVGTLQSSNLCFQVYQSKYDNNYMLCPLSFAQDLFEKQGCISGLELKLKSDADEADVKERLQKLAGPTFKVMDRYEQQEGTFNVMKIEKLFAFFFLTFIALVACFNIIGSLSMLIIDKRDDVDTLRHLGATDKDILRIFLFEGRLITALGAIIGLLLGLLLCFLQQEYGLLRLGTTAGSFIVDAYPVSVHAEDILVIFVTVIAVGFLSVRYPVRYLGKRLLRSGQAS